MLSRTVPKKIRNFIGTPLLQNYSV
ncbi:hypothetical protein ALTER154_100018 [Alteromonas sp. 154]|nr:hypothetical protein ALTER154_100018 [Alteromonas sp. 154]